MPRGGLAGSGQDIEEERSGVGRGQKDSRVGGRRSWGGWEPPPLWAPSGWEGQMCLRGEPWKPGRR